MAPANKWLVLNCPLCGFRFPLKKFDKELKPILFPLGVAGSLGRARGFATLERLPWSALTTLQNTEAWNSVLGIYQRLAAAYDHFYEFCGFLSPLMTDLIRELRKSYPDSYLTSPFQTYAPTYTSINSNIAETYAKVDYTDVYTLFWNQNVPAEET